ncbi:hypothetical protein SAMN05216236_12314 [Sedimentitalea nanhaiensis]|uniref:Uncharacterized protein n=2 Tax=Sedimentitalea nanhaiensis TaxID=999627 RepID=A0A1I7D584_9RHOB|nr:hypothetical protein SAMN05216236_12314 [Sedimentitalea nanhaiensis]
MNLTTEDINRVLAMAVPGVVDAKIQASRNKRNRGYIDRYKPNAKTRALLDQAQAVLEEYRRFWPLTCRQIFYRMVGAHGYDKTESAYGRLCHHLANARRGKVIPFDAIRDDGVTTWTMDHFDDQDDFLRHVRELGEGYTRNKLAAQDIHLEVWCEAAGMLPQLYRVAEPFSVPVFSSGGFDSLTAKKRLADRICAIEKRAIILHLGDFDPSGVSIFDAVAEDVETFVMSDRPHGLVGVEFERVALIGDQVQSFDLPTAPAKASDSRSKNWTGGTCQLEALPPDAIADILKLAIERRIDWKQYAEDPSAEETDRMLISGLLPAPEYGEGN